MKKVAIVIGALVGIYLILAFIGPKEIKVERSVSINAPKSSVYELVKDMKFFQERWSPWSKRDSAMEVDYYGEVGTVGSGYSWKGNKEVGVGTLEFTGFTEDSILQKLSFEGMGDSKAYYVITEADSVSSVTWGVSFEVDFFSRPIMLFMNMDKMMGGDFEEGLGMLKVEGEKQIRYSGYTITTEDWSSKVYCGVRSVLKFDKMKPFFETNYAKLMAAVKKSNVEMLGAPSAMYYMWDEANMSTDVAAVVPVASDVALAGFKKFEVPASKVLKIAYYGSWEGSANAHYAMDNYLKDNNMSSNLVIEEYVTDPKTVSNEQEILTNIYYVLD